MAGCDCGCAEGWGVSLWPVALCLHVPCILLYFIKCSFREFSDWAGGVVLLLSGLSGTLSLAILRVVSLARLPVSLACLSLCLFFPLSFAVSTIGVGSGSTSNSGVCLNDNLMMIKCKSFNDSSVPEQKKGNHRSEAQWRRLSSLHSHIVFAQAHFSLQGLPGAATQCTKLVLAACHSVDIESSWWWSNRNEEYSCVLPSLEDRETSVYFCYQQEYSERTTTHRRPPSLE